LLWSTFLDRACGAASFWPGSIPHSCNQGLFLFSEHGMQTGPSSCLSLSLSPFSPVPMCIHPCLPCVCVCLRVCVCVCVCDEDEESLCTLVRQEQIVKIQKKIYFLSILVSSENHLLHVAWSPWRTGGRKKTSTHQFGGKSL
jgi:hypothetical protein